MPIALILNFGILAYPHSPYHEVIMRIVKIMINNFRSIKHLTFYPEINDIIIGQVNSGKSTILSSLALALDPDIGRRFQVVDETDFYGMKLIDENSKPIPLNIEVTLSECSPREQDAFLEYWEPWDHKEKTLVEDAEDISLLENSNYKFAFRIAFKASYDPNEDIVTWIWYYPKYSFVDGSADYRRCPRADREKVGFFYIPAERDVRKALSFSRYSALDKALRADNIRLDGQIRKIAEEIRGKGTYLFENKGFLNLVQELEDQIGSLIPLNSELDRRISFEMSGLGQYDVMNVLRAFIAFDNQDNAYPINSQGTGAKQILVLAALQMISRRKQSSILAVEEPEIGLHPHIQRALVDSLLCSSSQFFITTHSAQVARVAKQRYVFCLINKGGGNRQIVPVEPSINFGCPPDSCSAVIQVYGHYPSDIYDALFTPYVLLLEGIGDRQAVPILLRRLSHAQGETRKELDGLGIGVVPCQSKASIPKIALYFKSQLDKKVYALLDNEKSTESVNSSTIDACDYTFIWPKGYAVERVLFNGIKDATVDIFIQYVIDLGGNYFDHALSKTKDISGRREDLFNYLKKEKARHRDLAELLALDEITHPVIQLFDQLNIISRGNNITKVMQLDP